MAIPANNSINNIQIIDPVLTNLLIGYKPANFIMDELFTRCPVGTTFGRIPKFTGTQLKLESGVYLSPSNIPTITVNATSTDTFLVKNHLLKSYYTNTDAQQFGGVSQVESIWNFMLADNLMIARERAAAAVLCDATVVTQTSAPTVAWSDYTSSDPLSDFKTARAAVMTGSGMEANTVVMSWDVYNVLISHPQLIKVAIGFAVDGNFAGTLNKAQLAKAMGVERVLVGKARYNSAELGQTQVLSAIWTAGTCIFCYINPVLTPNMAQQSLGYSFVPATPLVGYETYAYAEPEPLTQAWMGKWVIQGRMYDDNIVDVKCAYLFTSAV